MWVLIVFFISCNACGNAPAAMNMQQFTSQETCSTAGIKMWELSGRKANWSCVKQ